MKNYISLLWNKWTAPAEVQVAPVVKPLTPVPGLRVENIMLYSDEGIFYLVDSEGGKHVPSFVPDGDGGAKLVFTKIPA
jgi:hypothetical protein